MHREAGLDSCLHSPGLLIKFHLCFLTSRANSFGWQCGLGKEIIIVVLKVGHRVALAVQENSFNTHSHQSTALMLLEWGNDYQSHGNLNYEFPFSSVGDFMEQVEHFLACKSIAISTWNLYRFHTGLHQNRFGSISHFWQGSTQRELYQDVGHGEAELQTCCLHKPCALHFGLRSFPTLIGCSEFCVEDPNCKRTTLRICCLSDRLRDMDFPSFFSVCILWLI